MSIIIVVSVRVFYIIYSDFSIGCPKLVQCELFVLFSVVDSNWLFLMLSFFLWQLARVTVQTS